jgi:hypothetical protein
MSDPSSLRQYAQAYRRLAEVHPSPELRTLLIRMAEVWDAFAVHTDRIAAKRAAAEKMPDAPVTPGLRDVKSRVRSPELSPSNTGPTPRHEYTD